MGKEKNTNNRSNADKIDSVPKKSKKWVEDNNLSNEDNSETSKSDDKVWSEESKSEEEDQPVTKNKRNDSEDSESEDDYQLTSNEVVSSKSEPEVNAIKTEMETSNNEKNDAVEDNEERDQRTVHAVKIPREINETHIKLLFSKFGKLQEVTKRHENRKICQYDIVYKNREDAVKSLEINGMEYRGHHFIVVKNLKEKVRRKYSVCVKCSADIGSNVLWHAFESCGVIKRIDRFQGDIVIIRFESTDSVEIALKMGKVTIGNQKLSISKVKKEDILLPIQIPPKRSTAKVKKESKQSKKVPKKALHPSKHHQRAAQPSQRQYRQQPAGVNNYYGQPPQKQYHQKSGGFNNYYGQPSQRQYHQQSARHATTFRSNNYFSQPAQSNRYQGHSRPQREFAHSPQVAQQLKVEDVLGPSIEAHKHKLNARTFTITFNGDTLGAISK